MPLRFASPVPEFYRQPLTIRHLLDAGEQGDHDQQIIYRDAVRMSYGDLRTRIGRLAGALRTIGVEEGITVAVLDWDSHRYLEAFFAIPMMGAVLQTANIRLSPAQLQYTLDHARAEILLVHRDFLPLIEVMRRKLPHVREVVAIMDGASDPPPDWCAGEYEALLASNAPAMFADFNEDAVATTFYTSGTTGLPKAVCFSHRQLVLHALAVATALGSAAGAGLRRGDVYMPLTPMFHVHAWGLPYVATMLGLKQVFPGRYEPDLIVRLRRNEGVDFSHCVPTVLQMVIAATDASHERLDGWHFVIGGSAITADLYKAATDRGAVITAGYGMSETGPMIALGRTGLPGDDPKRSGTPIPLVSARLVDEHLTELPADDEALGELVLRAPWLTSCYVGDSAASKTLWHGGWLHTQDIATIASNGSIQIRDRIKDVIKTGGEWICSLTLENLILHCPDVSEVAVVGVPDPKWQERPVAFIVSAAGRNPTLLGVRKPLVEAAARGVISRYAVIDAAFLSAALPKTSVGKVDKKAIRAMLKADTSTGVRPLT